MLIIKKMIFNNDLKLSNLYIHNKDRLFDMEKFHESMIKNYYYI